jgi:hypothetical protein
VGRLERRKAKEEGERERVGREGWVGRLEMEEGRGKRERGKGKGKGGGWKGRVRVFTI